MCLHARQIVSLVDWNEDKGSRITVTITFSPHSIGIMPGTAAAWQTDDR